MKFELVKATDAWVTRQKIAMAREPHFYPSEASAVWTDKYGIRRVAGTCLRRCYYRYTGEVVPAPTSPYSEWIFSLGKAVEEILIEQWKQMGIWVANNIKFYDKDRNISGEVDVILSQPDGKLFGTEVKSFYGYQATRDLIGNKKVSPAPKTSQLMQTLIYVDQCKEFLDYFKMVYYARDSANRTEFDITLTQDGDVKRPTINGMIDFRFTMEDIYSRYVELQDWVEKGVAPPQDFEIVWSPEKVEQRKEIGEVAKTTYEKWKKKPSTNPIGDWQCRYCPYVKDCWNKS